MKKRGLVLKIILIALLVVVLLIVGVVFYFYNYFVFETLRVCVTENVEDTFIDCSSDAFCIEELKNNLSEMDESDEEFPDFIIEKMDEVFETAIYCENTCHIFEVRGMDGVNLQEIESCNDSETEIKMEIRGREVLAFFKMVGG